MKYCNECQHFNKCDPSRCSDLNDLITSIFNSSNKQDVKSILDELFNAIYDSLTITLSVGGFKTMQDFNFTWDRIVHAFDLAQKKLFAFSGRVDNDLLSNSELKNN